VAYKGIYDAINKDILIKQKFELQIKTKIPEAMSASGISDDMFVLN